MSPRVPFQFECPAVFFEKASAPPGQRRRIAGIISTESRDRQKEVVIQKGLDFDPFINHGWFNDNHSKNTAGIVGYPDSVKYFAKGQKLPNGQVAHTNMHWSEGYLLEGHEPADKLWNLGQSLQKSGGDRRLGFSIEGNVEKRIGAGRKTIAKARVRNVAITNCPVNVDTRLEVIAKSLMAVQTAEEEPLLKGLGMGTATGPAISPGTEVSGMGAGQVLAPESLETGQLRALQDEEEKKQKGKRKKKLNKAEAILWLHTRLPQVSAQTLGRIVDTTLLLKRNGKL